MPTNPSIGWQKLLYAYYNIRTCYDSLNWGVNSLFSTCKVAISPYTTLLALADKLTPNPSVIEVYSISGSKMWSLFHNAAVPIVDFAFYGENLVVVLSNYTFRIYTDFYKTFNQYAFNMDFVPLTNLSDNLFDGSEAYKQVVTNLETNEIEEVLEIVQTYVWGNFLVVRYRNKLTVTNLLDFSNYEIPLVGMDPGRIHCMTSLAVSDHTLDCLLNFDSTVYQISLDTKQRTYELIDKVITVGPFTMMASSPNGAFVALFNAEDSQIYVSNKEFDRELLIYDTLNESSAPYMMEWAGEDAIILSLREEIKLIGPRQSSLSFFYDIVDPQHFDLSWNQNSTANEHKFCIPIIKSEKDGLKIITDNKVEFLARVPQSSIDLLQVGTSHPSSILLDCVDKLQHQASKADTNITYLKSEGSLETAIAGCLDAALDEFSAIWQKKILKAVSFGKIYDENYYNADEYLRVVNTVKVLNQIRSPEIGLFLTYPELVDAGWPAIIQMLLKRSKHVIAIKVIQLLKLKDVESIVYVDWCCRRIMNEPDMPQWELFKIILKKLLSAQRHTMGKTQKNIIPVADIFQIAHQMGRMDLCQMLVDIEPSAVERVNLLLDIDQVELALIKCFKSVDSDLCRLLLLHLNDAMPLTKFLEVLNQVERKGSLQIDPSDKSQESEYIQNFMRDELFVSGDIIANFWENSIAKNNPKLLDSYYRYDDKTAEIKKLKFRKYIAQVENAAVTDGEYDSFYQMEKNKLQAIAGDKKLSKLLNLELDLLDTKKKLSETFQQSFFQEKSVVAVVEKLIDMKQTRVAAEVCRNHKVPSQKLWNLILEKYCKAGEFERLHSFIVKANPKGAKVLKAPIRFERIALTCIFYKAPPEHVDRYIASCVDESTSWRAQRYLDNVNFEKAMEEATKTDNPDLIQLVKNKRAAATSQ